MRLVNFQKHKDLQLELDTINVITGATDSGKTSVLRALLWALTNNAAGANVCNYEANNCRVELDVDDHTIVRDWDKTTKAYILDGREFLAFRTTVHKPIAELLHISDINIQERRDPPFMVYYTASDCANQFSEMLELTEIDGVIRNSNKAVKGKDADVSKIKSSIKDTERALRRKSDLDKALEELNDIHKRRKEYIATSDNLKRLRGVLERYTEAEAVLAKYKAVPEAVQALQLLYDSYNKYTESTNKLNSMKQLMADRTHALREVRKYSTVNDALNALSKLSDLGESVKSENAKLKMLQGLLATYKEATHKVSVWDERCTQLTMEYNIAMPEVCPLCGSTQNCKGGYHE
jgi:exonuclease SbcC